MASLRYVRDNPFFFYFMFMNSKKYLFIYSFLLLFVCSFFSLNFIPHSSGYYVSEDYVYSFSAPDLTFDIDNLSLGYNYEYAKNYSGGSYVGSYSFFNETSGDDPLWFNEIENDGDHQIYSYFDGHDDLCLVDDPSTGGMDYIYQDIEEEYGSIELWVYFDSYTHKGGIIRLYEISNSLLSLYVYSGHLYCNDGSDHDLGAISIDQWAHVRIDFECSSFGYNNLASDGYHIYYDFKLEYSGIMDNSPGDVTQIRYGNSISTSSMQSSFFDAIGYSWLDNYTLCDNFLTTYSNDTSQICNSMITFDVNENILYRTQNESLPYAVGYKEIDEFHRHYYYGYSESPEINLVNDVEDNSLLHFDTAPIAWRRSISVNDDDIFYLSYDIDIDMSSSDMILLHEFYYDYYGAHAMYLGFINDGSNVDVVAGDAGAPTYESFLVGETSFSGNIRLMYSKTMISMVVELDDGVVYYYRKDISSYNYDATSHFEFISYSNLYIDNLSLSLNGSQLLSDYGLLTMNSLDFAQLEGNYVLTDSNELGLFNVYDNYSFNDSFNVITPTLSIEGSLLIPELVLYENTLLFECNGLISTFTNAPSDVVIFKDNVYEVVGIEDNGVNAAEDSYFYTDEDDMIIGHFKYEGLNSSFIKIEFDVENFKSTDYFLTVRDSFITSNYLDACFGITYIDNTYDEIRFESRNFLDYSFALSPYLWVDSFYLKINFTDNSYNNSYMLGGFQTLYFNYIRSDDDNFDGQGILGTIISIVVIIVPTMILVGVVSKTPLNNNRDNFKITIFYPVLFLMCTIAFAGGIIPLWLYFISIITNGIMIIARRRLDD